MLENLLFQKIWIILRGDTFILKIQSLNDCYKEKIELDNVQFRNVSRWIM